MKQIICAIFGHKWDWYLPNYKGTVIGTQWCTRCKCAMRGVYVKAPNVEVRGAALLQRPA